MVTHLTRRKRPRRGTRRPLIEITGPPGSGKTTVIEELRRCLAITVVGPLKPVRRESLAVTPPSDGRGGPDAGAFAPAGGRPVRWTAKLLALRVVLYRARRRGNRAALVVVDQGPVYTLARLRSLRHTGLAARWQERQVAYWAGQLGAVVVLDAPDDVLLERIAQRAKAHMAKSSPSCEARDLIRRQRSDLHFVLDGLARHGFPHVAIDSSTADPAGLAAQILRHFGPSGDT